MRTFIFFAIILFTTTLNAQIEKKGPTELPVNLQLEKTKTTTSPTKEKTKLTVKIIKDWNLGDILVGAKVLSGEADIVFSPETPGKAVKQNDGTVKFVKFTDITIKANTSGVIVGVRKEAGSIVEIKVSFWPGRDDLYVTFGPSVGTDPVFILVPNNSSKYKIGEYVYALKSGGTETNPISLETETAENVPSDAPGRKN